MLLHINSIQLAKQDVAVIFYITFYVAVKEQ